MVPEPAEAMHQTGARRALSVLVVESDPPSRDGLRLALIHDGCSVEAVADAWQALARIRRARFDVAVVDLDLPSVHGLDLGGWDLVRIARGYQPDISLILLSTDDDPSVFRQARALGVAGLLAKPIGLAQLRRLMGRVLTSDKGGRAAGA